MYWSTVVRGWKNSPEQRVGQIRVKERKGGGNNVGRRNVCRTYKRQANLQRLGSIMSRELGRQIEEKRR